MSRGYKRRKRGIAAGTYETPGQRSAWVMEQFKENIFACFDALTDSMDAEREQWLDECRRLLVEKYAIRWPEQEIADYAESLACYAYDDPDWRTTPDNAIEEDFHAGL